MMINLLPILRQPTAFSVAEAFEELIAACAQSADIAAPHATTWFVHVGSDHHVGPHQQPRLLITSGRRFN